MYAPKEVLKVARELSNNLKKKEGEIMADKNRKCPFCPSGDCSCEKPFDLAAMPEHKADGIARAIYPAILAYFDNPENNAKYEKWLVKWNEKKSKQAAFAAS